MAATRSGAGHPYAQRRLAQCLRLGKGVNKDGEEAMQWYRRAAEQEDAQAMLDLGQWLVYAPDSVVANQREGMGWVEKAAEAGLAEAQFVMGRLYWKGVLAPKNMDKCWKWMQRAADQRHLDALAVYGVQLSGVGRPARP